MYLMYVDESGDSGLINSPKRFFILSGMIVHETKWNQTFEQLISFREKLKSDFGIKLREELHAYELISRPKHLRRIKKNDRLSIVRRYADELASMETIQFINVAIDKGRKPESFDVFEMAWKALIQRFENTLKHKNFLHSEHNFEHGLIFPDRTDDKKLTQLIRKMRRYNPVPNAIMQGVGYTDRKLVRIAEDPSFKDSQHSYFIQSTDLVAYLLQQQLDPSKYMRKKSGHNYFKRLDPVLCKVASRYNCQGIVEL